jgi:hypothetical protein
MDTVALLTYAQTCFISNNLPSLQGTVTLGATTASVTFNVQSQYQRLMVLWGGRGTTSATGIQLMMQFNGNTSSTYLWSHIENITTTITGSGSAGLVSQIQMGTLSAASSAPNYWSSGAFFVEGVNQANHNQTAVGIGTAYDSDANPPLAYTGVYGGSLLGPSLVTSLTLFPLSGSFVSGSYFAFYGLS